MAIGKREMRIKKVVVKKSVKRKKTIAGRLKNGTLTVLAPQDISDKQLQKVIENFKIRFEKRHKKQVLNRGNELPKRAEMLNKKYFNGELYFNKISYSVDQKKKLGVCYSDTKTILINACLKDMPQWVEDYVIVHELAHLKHPNHSKDFWKAVRKYPKTERAIGYLLAKGIEEK